MGRQSRRGRNELRVKWGGRCQRCGYSRCLSALEFHHLYPELKVGRSNAPVGEVRRHPERFMLICSNCSHEIHDCGQVHFRGNVACPEAS